MPNIAKHILDEADEIIRRHTEGEDADAGLDGGEFSGPEHSRMLQRAIDQLAARYNIGADDIFYALQERNPEKEYVDGHDVGDLYKAVDQEVAPTFENFGDYIADQRYNDAAFAIAQSKADGAMIRSDQFKNKVTKVPNGIRIEFEFGTAVTLSMRAAIVLAIDLRQILDEPEYPETQSDAWFFLERVYEYLEKESGNEQASERIVELTVDLFNEMHKTERKKICKVYPHMENNYKVMQGLVKKGK